MTPPTTYLDWNATAPLLPAAREAILSALALGGNPSAVHAGGRAARRLVEGARESVADKLGAASKEIVFTSGATEANALAIFGLRPVVGHILVSAIEHASVLDAVKASGLPYDIIPVTEAGVVDLTALTQRLDALRDTIDGLPLIAVMGANNETGALQPLGDIVACARTAGALVHCDAVQLLAKVPLSFRDLGVDTMTVSAHKIGGPSGIGALVMRDDLPLVPQLRGGGQERRRRAGTENLAGVAGFAAAAREIPTMLQEVPRLAQLRDRLEDRLARIAQQVVFFGRSAARLCNTSAFATPEIRADVQVVALDLEGIAEIGRAHV